MKAENKKTGWTDERRAAASERMKRVRPVDHKGSAMTKSTGAGRGHRPGTLNFIAAVGGVAPAPCETCAHYSKCSTYLLACVDFSVYCEYGSDIRNAAVNQTRQLKALRDRLKASRVELRDAKAAKDKGRIKEAKRKVANYTRTSNQYAKEVQRLTDFGQVERDPTRKQYVRTFAGTRAPQMSKEDSARDVFAVVNFGRLYV